VPAELALGDLTEGPVDARAREEGLVAVDHRVERERAEDEVDQFRRERGDRHLG